MNVTATQLVTFWTCPFLWHVSYEQKEPLPRWGSRRRFGTVVHAAIAEYERHGRSIDRALRALEAAGAGLAAPDMAEARSILAWRHEALAGRRARPILVEGALRAYLGGHRLDIRMDRLDAWVGDYELAEYKAGRSVDPRLVRTQMSILAYAVLDVFGRAPRRWQVELLRTRTLLELPAEADARALRSLPEGLIQAIGEGDREPRPFDRGFCRGCPAREYCPRWSSSPRPFSRPVPRQADPQRLLF